MNQSLSQLFNPLTNKKLKSKKQKHDKLTLEQQ